MPLNDHIAAENTTAMSLFDPDVKITADGVYRPLPGWIGAIGCAFVFLLLIRQLYLGKIPLYAALLLALLAVALPVYTKLKYGKSGVPVVKLSSADLVLSLPNESRSKVRFDLRELHEIQVYGRARNRKFRFLQQDGRFADVTPLYGARMQQAVVQFLMTNLPSHIAVKICEPQTFFEEVRGDGP